MARGVDLMTTKFNRNNIKGDGPDRTTLPLAKKLGTVSQSIIDLCLFELNSKKLNEVNHCGTEMYPISVTSPLMQLFSPDYKQTLLQLPTNTGEHERDYVIANSPIVDEIDKYLNKFKYFRGRFANLPAGEIIDWHIDTNTSVYCRIQLTITGTTTWLIKCKNEITEITIPAGEIWFFNTGYSHRVENRENIDRWSIILNCDYSEIARVFGNITL
jgi:hypothetical protein